jgi:plastocyanin
MYNYKCSNLSRSVIVSILVVPLCGGNIILFENVYAKSNEALAANGTSVQNLSRADRQTNGNSTTPPNHMESTVNNSSTALVSINEEESDKPYDPSPLTIKNGESARWTNDDFETHTVTSGSEKDKNLGMLFDSGEMERGDTFTHKFDNVGSYIYFCIIHPIMTGMVIVR